jgi:5-methylcytosine-specific restriction endonuclease McrA
MPVRESKICSCCKESLPLSDFHKDSKSPDGSSYWCKDCSSLRRKKNREDNLDHQKNTQKVYYLNNKKSLRQSNEEWKKNNPGKMLEYNQKYRDNHRDRVRLAVKTSKLKNPDKSKNSVKEWFANNPLKRIEYNNKRRATKASVGGVVLSSEWESLLDKYNHVCLRCGRDNVKLTLDHVVPISKGGRNTIDNIQPLCGKCNSFKSTKTIDYRLLWQ